MHAKFLPMCNGKLAYMKNARAKLNFLTRNEGKCSAFFSLPSDSISRDFTTDTCNVNMALLACCNKKDCCSKN